MKKRKKLSLNVLFEDNHIIAVEKTAGMLVHGDETGDRTLQDHVKTYIKKKYNKPGDVVKSYLLFHLHVPTYPQSSLQL